MTVGEALGTLDEHPVQLALVVLQYPEVGSALMALASHARGESEAVLINAANCRAGRAGWEGQT